MKRLLGFVSLPLIILITASLTSGLELSASTGSNDGGGSASMGVRYGATIDDYNHEHIHLSPNEGTLSNAFSISGTLPFATISAKAQDGTQASVSRSVIGKPGVTKGSYDWVAGTHGPPGTSFLAFADLKLAVEKAYTIYGSGYASNQEGDFASGSMTVSSSQPTSTLIGYEISVDASPSRANALQNLVYAYGASASINSQGLDTALGVERISLNTKTGVETNTKINRGEGDFTAVKTTFNNVGVTTVTTKNDISITPTGFGANTALILDPRRYEFVTLNRGQEIRDSVTNSLVSKGYAVTYYSDAAVSKDKVAQMDDNLVSVISTHMDPTQIYLSKSSDGITYDKVSASELKNMYTKSNGMTLLVGCNSFKNSFTNTGKPISGTLADAVSKASCSGGTTDYWSITYNRNFIAKYFQLMAKGSPASQANLLAMGLDYAYDANGNLISGYKVKALDMRGSNTNFKL